MKQINCLVNLQTYIREWFLLPNYSLIFNHKEIQKMAKRLDIMEDQIELGQVKTITSQGGKFVNYCELLFSTTTKVQFAPSENNDTVEFAVSDNYLELPQLQCNIDKETLRNLIMGLKKLYNQLEEKEG